MAATNNKTQTRLEFKIRSINNKSRTTNNENILFIEGGGTKGVFALGILKYLFEPNPYVDLSKINTVGGTSIGSFFAAALSLGYDSIDLQKISEMIDISKIFDNSYLMIPLVYRFISKGYLYDDTGRRDLIQKIINVKIDKIKKHLGRNDIFEASDLTFGHLKKLIDDYPTVYKNLIINAVDINKSDQIFFTTLDDNSSNIRIIDAILASSSIPFVFKTIELHSKISSNVYHYHKSSNATTNNLIDGGVSTNNPLDYVLLNPTKFQNHTLWLIKFSYEPSYTKIHGTIDMLKHLANYLISGKNDVKMNLIEDQFNINTINLNSTAGTLDFYNQQQIQKIMNEVYQLCLEQKIKFESA